MMEKYEVMFIVKNTIEDDSVKAVADSLQGIITKGKGKIIEFKEMGKRKLAYPIKKQNEGYYVLINFSSNPDFIDELERVYNITDEIIKHIIVKKD